MSALHTVPPSSTSEEGKHGLRIGIFGGSFNPIHNAHVALARSIREEAGLDEVWFLVSPHNPLKPSSSLLDENLRLELARTALAEEEGLVASDFEFHLPRPSYTWNTLQQLRQQYPHHTFYIIIGGDNWKLFDRWSHWEDILRNYPIIIYPRTASDIDASTLPPGVRLVNTPLIDITSTQIRQLVAQGLPIDNLVPSKIVDRVEKLY